MDRRYIIRLLALRAILGQEVRLVRCPLCSVEIDVDEDEVEEGEILNCSECEAEIEIVQVHPIRLNVISDEDDDDEEDEDDEKDDVEPDALREEEDEVE
jgi:alpha-aminoadipate/glutamate carrier protein LysW